MTFGRGVVRSSAVICALEVVFKNTLQRVERGVVEDAWVSLGPRCRYGDVGCQQEAWRTAARKGGLELACRGRRASARLHSHRRWTGQSAGAVTLNAASQSPREGDRRLTHHQIRHRQGMMMIARFPATARGAFSANRLGSMGR